MIVLIYEGCGQLSKNKQLLLGSCFETIFPTFFRKYVCTMLLTLLFFCLTNFSFKPLNNEVQSRCQHFPHLSNVQGVRAFIKLCASFAYAFEHKEQVVSVLCSEKKKKNTS